MDTRVAFVGVAVLVSAAACGGSSRHQASRGSDASRIAIVLSATDAASTAGFETIVAISGEAAPVQQVDGVLDFTAKLGSATVTMPNSRTDQPQASVERRWIGSTIYAQIKPGDLAFFDVPSDRSWIALDLDRIAQVAQCYSLLPTSAPVGLLGTSALGTARPDDILDKLRASGATLAQVGSDTVRAIPTTHWRVGSQLPETTTIPAKCGDPVMHEDDRIEIWTDAQNRLRRIADTITITSTSPPSPTPNLQQPATTSPPDTLVSGTTTTDFFDFGVSVHVTAPPQDQVYDLTDTLIHRKR